MTVARKLRFGVEVLDHDFEDAKVLEAVEEAIPRYGIEEILFWGGINILDQDVETPGYEGYETRQQSAKAARFREWMKRVRDRGLHEKTYIMAGVTPLKSAGMARYMRDQVPGL